MKNSVIFLIRLYQLVSFIPQGISQTVLGTTHQCIYEPTCSHYMIGAVQKYGAIKGVKMGIKRIMRCRPGKTGGYDPVR